MESEKYNKAGMWIFGLAFVVILGIYVLVMERNPGPIDSRWSAVVAKGISHEEIMKRESEWRQSSSESIALGKQLYAINCAGCHALDPSQPGQDVVLQRIQNNQTKYGVKETDLYRVIYRGVPVWGERVKQTMPRQDAITSPNRWALVHYMRSLAPNAPAATSSDWKALDSEIIW